MNAFEDNDWRSFDHLCDLSPLVQCEIISRNLAVLPRKKFIEFFVRQIEVESPWVVEVVISCVLMLVITVGKESKVS